MSTYKGILLAKSPYYITEVGDPGFASNLEIRVWNGDIATEPVDANYSMQKQTLSSTTDTVTFEVGKIIESYFEHLPNPSETVASLHTDALWVNIKSGDGDTNRDDTWLAIDGYSYFLDGLNYDYTGASLISEDILYHYEGIPITLPVHNQGTTRASQLVFKKNGSIVYTDDFNSNNTSDNSYDKVVYTSNTGSVGSFDSVEIQNSAAVVLKTLTIKEGICNKYTPYIVSFINKFGVNQQLVFSAASKESINTSKESFKRQTLDISTGTPTYNIGKHVYKDNNLTVRESISLNSNYIDESLNDTIGQLISSDDVWITVNGITSPANVTTQTLEYKSNVNDGLINYKINFTYAFNKRQNIY